MDVPMEADIENKLRALLPIGGVQSIKVGSVPSGPSARYPGTHLYINCVYDPTVTRMPADDALAFARRDVLSVLKTVVCHPGRSPFRSFCVTFIYRKVAGSDEQALPVGQCRFYRYSILAEGLNCSAESLDIDYLISNSHFQESSELDRVQALIAANPRYDPHFWESGKPGTATNGMKRSRKCFYDKDLHYL